jgi:acyl-CoA synthetase (AMP-forming)/AMP-acid ligase II
MFGSPALLKRIVDAGTTTGIKLNTLKRVISAGAPVPQKVLSAFSTLLRPETQIFTPYGATEALPVCSIGSAELLSNQGGAGRDIVGICVGKPVTGVDLRIIEITDDPIAEWSESLEVAPGEIGEIVVQGRQVTKSYFNDPAADRLGKIRDRKTGGIFHRMGDLGYRDENGRIWFCGRKNHRVITREDTLFTIPCEAVFNAHELVNRTALVGIGKKGYERPVICVEAHGKLSKSAKARVRAELLTLGGRSALTKNIKTVAFYDRPFPVDVRHNAKIFREKLKKWAERQDP